jgi:hypothetical protein
MPPTQPIGILVLMLIALGASHCGPGPERTSLHSDQTILPFGNLAFTNPPGFSICTESLEPVPVVGLCYEGEPTARISIGLITESVLFGFGTESVESIKQSISETFGNPHLQEFESDAGNGIAALLTERYGFRQHYAWVYLEAQGALVQFAIGIPRDASTPTLEQIEELYESLSFAAEG